MNKKFTVVSKLKISNFRSVQILSVYLPCWKLIPMAYRDSDYSRPEIFIAYKKEIRFVVTTYSVCYYWKRKSDPSVPLKLFFVSNWVGQVFGIQERFLFSPFKVKGALGHTNFLNYVTIFGEMTLQGWYRQFNGINLWRR